MRLTLEAKPPIPTPVLNVFQRDDIKNPVCEQAFQPSVRDVAGGDVIPMIHGSIRRIAGKNSPDAYVSLYDEFDIYNKGQLSTALEESVGCRTITIDLAHTTFIDASILGVLVGLAGRCRKHNAAQVRIVNASTYLRRLFSICQLENVFDIEDQRTHTPKPRGSRGSIASGARHRAINRISAR